MDGPLISGFLAVVALLLKLYFSKKPQLDKEREYESIQKGREAVNDGDVVAVNARIDGLLSGGSVSSEGNTQAGDSVGQHSDESTAARIQKLLDS